MAQIQVLISIGIMIISLIAGIVFYFFMSPIKQTVKKDHIKQILSFIIDMVIFIWVSKVIVNIGQFIHDPLAVLAYPSDSTAFYLAIGIMIVYLAYKHKRNKLSIESLIDSFIPIFIGASFVYEFIQVIWYGKSWPYLALLLILMFGYLLVVDKIPNEVSKLLVLGWSGGQLLLAVFLPFTSIFKYIISPWFFTVVMIVTLFLMFHKRKKVTRYGDH